MSELTRPTWRNTLQVKLRVDGPDAEKTIIEILKASGYVYVVDVDGCAWKVTNGTLCQLTIGKEEIDRDTVEEISNPPQLVNLQYIKSYGGAELQNVRADWDRNLEDYYREVLQIIAGDPTKYRRTDNAHDWEYARAALEATNYGEYKRDLTHTVYRQSK